MNNTLLQIRADEKLEIRHNDNMMVPRLYSVAEACELLSIGRTKLYDLLNQNLLKAVKIGRNTVFRPSDITNFINSLPDYEVKDV